MLAANCKELEPGSSDSCRQVRSPIWVIKVFVSLLRQYFGSPERTRLEQGTYIWRDDPDTSEIYIEDEFNWNITSVGKRPALIVTLGGIAESKDTATTLGRSGVVGYDSSNDSYIFASVDQVSLSIQGVSGSKLDSIAVAWEARSFLRTYAMPIEKEYMLHQLSSPNLGNAQKFEEYKDYWATPVNISFNLVDSWALTTESLKVKSIGMTVKTTVEAVTPVP